MKTFKKSMSARLLGGGVLLASSALLAVSGTASAADSSDSGWKPTHPVNLIIMAGKGGGADKLARLWQSIVAKHKLAPQPLIPINKPGGSGAEALNYMMRKEGSKYDIMVTLNSLYTTPLRLKGLDIDPSKLTGIRVMATDTFQLWVSTKKYPDIKTVDDWVKAVKKADGEWRMGGTGSGQEDSLLTAMLADHFDLDMKYIPYKGGGTVASQLIGGHIDSTVNNPAEQIGFMQADKSRPLATFTEERLPELYPGLKTMNEIEGTKDLAYTMDRMVVAPPDMPEDAQKFYVDLFEKVSQTDEWNSYVEKNGLQKSTIEGKEMSQYITKRYKLHKKLVPLWEEFQKM